MTLAAPRPDEALTEGNGNFLSRVWTRWVSDVSSILGGQQPFKLAEYTVATLPDAAKWSRHAVYVTDETGGEVLAVSDGTDWRRQTDRSVVA